MHKIPPKPQGLRLCGLPVLCAALLLTACTSDGRAGPKSTWNKASWNKASWKDSRTSRMKSLVIEEAARMRVPASLALAVAHAESSFNARAESSKGARGIMQIMPATARGEYGIRPGLLWDPRINVRLGLHFLKRLIDRYRGRVDLALSHYNGGSRVGTWPNARVIPATRAYVDRVRRLRNQYRTRLLRGSV